MQAFQFKKFNLQHQNAAFKIGTDGVLLGAWANIEDAKAILDIGTGCGLIAIIAAQKNPQAQIYGVEIDPKSAQEAMQNAQNCPWHNRIQILQTSIQEYTQNSHLKFDHILSNPPFFNAGTHSLIANKNNARHTQTLSHQQLVQATAALLLPNGKASFILPPLEAQNMLAIAQNKGLFCCRKLEIKPRNNKLVDRWLFELQWIKQETETQQLCIRNQNDNEYSEPYKQICQDFYLKF